MSSFPSRLALEEISLFVCPSPGGCILASNLCLTTHPLNTSLHLHLQSLSGSLTVPKQIFLAFTADSHTSQLLPPRKVCRTRAARRRADAKHPGLLHLHTAHCHLGHLRLDDLASHRAREASTPTGQSTPTSTPPYPPHTTHSRLCIPRGRRGDDENLFHIRSFHSSRRHEPI